MTSIIFNESISKFYDDPMGMKIYSAIMIRAKKECFWNLEEFENMIMEKSLIYPVIYCMKHRRKLINK